jgi:hypothetical protein
MTRRSPERQALWDQRYIEGWECAERSMVIILYGRGGQINASTFLNLFVSLANTLGVKITSSEICERDSERFTHPRISKLNDIISNSPDLFLSVLSVYPSHKKFDIIGYSQLHFTSICYNEQRLSGSNKIIFAIEENLFKKGSLDIAKIFLAIPKEFRICYGGASLLSADTLFVAYANGTAGQDDDDGFFGDQSWFLQNIDSEHLRNKLINIFGVNYLSDGHLKFKINGEKFENWVQSKSYGELVSIKPGLWGWYVEKALKSEVRDILGHAGMLVSPDDLLSI